MARKLYPPNIEGTLPAFTKQEISIDNKSVLLDQMIIPYSMNKTVSFSEIDGFYIKIRTINSNTYLYSFNTASTDNLCDWSTPGKIVINFPAGSFNIGQYYKVQIAYYQETVVGYYSTVGIIKYTAEPEVYIDGLEINQVNTHVYNYVGVYSQSAETPDYSEKVYTYRFDLYDQNETLIKTTGDIIHNSDEDDNNYMSKDVFDLNQDLEENKNYYLSYHIKTINGLERSSKDYKIMQKRSIDPDLKADLVAELNFDNGYVSLSLVGKTDNSGNEYAATGDYKILRASEEDGYTTWTEILKFSLYGQKPSRWLWKDFTIRQGVNYKYGIQQYNDKLSSNRIESNIVYVDFEDAFLYDGERQLKIKYNPKITSFKDTLLESTVNTIGSKYPFIFRNGNVRYKQFPISGLISYQMDEEKLFMIENSFTMETATHNLTGENIAAERDFKLQVLDWLNDGKSKIFRSPTEGNYIVRLLNVSLSPTDTVGRMLHTFSATAYEVEEFNYSTLGDLGFLQTSDPSIEQIRWETINLSNVPTDTNLLNYQAIAISLTDMVPGDQIILTFKTDKGTKEQAIHIGATGSYIIDLNSNVTITSVKFKGQGSSSVYHQGSLTYAFLSKIQNKFDFIDDIDISDQPMIQIVGEANVFERLEDIRTEIQDIYFIHAIKRIVYPTNLIYNFEEDLDSLKEQIKNLLPGDEDPFALYQVQINNYLSETPTFGYYDAFNDDFYSDYNTSLEIDGQKISLEETFEQTWYNPDVETIITGSGVMLELGYQVRYATYNFDTYTDLYSEETVIQYTGVDINGESFTIPSEAFPEITTVQDLRKQYEIECQILYNLIYSEEINIIDDIAVKNWELQVKEQKAIVDRIYDIYLQVLSYVIEEELKIQGESA